MKKHVLVILTLIIILTQAGQALAADELARKIQSRYTDLSSLRAEFTQVLLHRESGGREERSGVLLFRKPMLLRWETELPLSQLLLVTENEIWDVIPEEELAYKYALSLTEDSAGLLRVVTGQARLEEDFYLERAEDEDGLAKIVLYPHEPTQSMTEAALWIEAENELIRKVRVLDFFGNENTISFEHIEIDAEAPDEAFTYTPPENFIVEDRSSEEAMEGLLQ